MKSSLLLISTIGAGCVLGSVLALATPAAVIQVEARNPFASAAAFEPSDYLTHEYGPDHYPLTTRSGTLAVEDLWQRRPPRMRPYTFAEIYPEPRPYDSEIVRETVYDERTGSEQAEDASIADMAAGEDSTDMPELGGVSESELASLPSGKDVLLP